MGVGKKFDSKRLSVEIGIKQPANVERGGTPPRRDEKSAEAIERKRVERSPSGKRVRKMQKGKRLDVGGPKKAGNHQRS